MKDSSKLFALLFLILLVITLFILFSEKFNEKIKIKSFSSDELYHDVSIEGFDMNNKKDEQDKFLVSQKNYYFNRIYKPELLIDNEIGKAIKKCRIINATGDCTQLTEDTQCGYCHDNGGSFLYGNENGVLGPTGEPLVNVCKDWHPPTRNDKLGMTVAQYECTKKKEREKCSEMKDCGDLNNPEFEKCGWCPFKQQGMVKKELTGNEIPEDMRDNMINNRKWWTSKYNTEYDKEGNDKSQYDECDWTDPKKYTDIIGNATVCDEFKQQFPCMGDKAFTGEHSVGCMNDQFKKAGCYPNRESENGYQKWPDLSDNKVYGPQIKRKENINKKGGDNPYMRVYDYFKKVFDYSKPEQKSKLTYREAKEMNELCWKEASVDPCDYKDTEAKNECLIKIYKEAGCEENGIAYPGNYDANPNFYKQTNLSKYDLNELKTSMENAYLDTQSYKDKIKQIHDDASEGTEFNNYNIKYEPDKIRKNIKAKTLCYGNDDIVKEKIGKDTFLRAEEKYKDCWDDFVLKMTTIPGIRYRGDTLYISKKESRSRKFIIKNLTTVGSKTGYIYTISRSDYEKPIFPFWEYKGKLQKFWFDRGSGWNLFKEVLTLLPGVINDGGTIIIDKDNILAKVQSKTNSEIRISYGQYHSQSNGIYTFPYWKYIHICINYIDGG